MKLTIFTPTFNRAKLLERVYRSLLRQTNYQFEWLIVDDGSTDDTESVVNSFRRDYFSIKYYKKQNGGKHTAHNFAVKKASGTFFICLDSDDELLSDAVDLILELIEKCSENEGLIAYKSDKFGALLSDTFPTGLERTTMTKLSVEEKCSGEFSLVFPTQLLKSHRFPVFEEERFIPESVLYDRISDYCQMIVVREVFTICEYQKEGYSNNIDHLMKNNPAGFALYYSQRINLQNTFINKSIVAAKYLSMKRRIKNKNNKMIVNDTKEDNKRIMVLSLPLSICFSIYYKIIRGF